MSQALSPVTFHGDTIFIISHNGEPYAPVKPIVENMGLDWATQFRKLKANAERWGIVMMTTPPSTSGRERGMMTIPSSSSPQQTLCMPVRKLPAFFASINPKKVKPELRERIELYQNECDDALWAYWTKGQATRKPRKTLPKAQAALPMPPARPAPLLSAADIAKLEAAAQRVIALSAYIQREIHELHMEILGTVDTRKVSDSIWHVMSSHICYSLRDAIRLTPESLTRNTFTQQENRNPAYWTMEMLKDMPTLR